jgi:hypothetical protein
MHALYRTMYAGRRIVWNDRIIAQHVMYTHNHFTATLGESYTRKGHEHLESIATLVRRAGAVQGLVTHRDQVASSTLPAGVHKLQQNITLFPALSFLVCRYRFSHFHVGGRDRQRKSLSLYFKPFCLKLLSSCFTLGSEALRSLIITGSK